MVFPDRTPAAWLDEYPTFTHLHAHHLLADQQRSVIDRTAADVRLREAVQLAEQTAATTVPIHTVETSAAGPVVAVHPIFGAVVHDFAHKQVFAVEPSILCDPAQLPVWKQQRVFQPARAAKMAAAMLNPENTLVCPGAITAVERDDGTVAIIDGQHRVGAINILDSENQLAVGTTVLLEVHRVTDEAHIAKLFTDINRSVPVHLVDMPNVTVVRCDSRKNLFMFRPAN
jgi:hypothetical protein